MSAISSFFDAPVAQRPASMSLRQVVAGFVSRIRARKVLPEAAEMPASDRRALRQSDYERIDQRWEGSAYREIRNQIDAFR